MHVKAKPPVLVPEPFRREIESLSKAALMDIAWDRAQMAAQTNDADEASTMAAFREHRDIVLAVRKPVTCGEGGGP